MKITRLHIPMLVLLTLWNHATFGMSSSLKATYDTAFKRDARLQAVCREYSEINSYAQKISSAALQQTPQGKTYFDAPNYEKYLYYNPTIPWQALFMANSRMIYRIENQIKIRNHEGQTISETPSEQFKHLQRATIYCETARQLLKCKRVQNPKMIYANIPALKRLAKEEYHKAYDNNDREALNTALHTARHRWNECTCIAFYAASPFGNF